MKTTMKTTRPHKHPFTIRTIPVGQVFGRLQVIEKVEDDEAGKARYLCRCTCGREKIVQGNNLYSGNTTSCGCLQHENLLRSPRRSKCKRATHLLDKYGNEVAVYSSISEAARALNRNTCGILRAAEKGWRVRGYFVRVDEAEIPWTQIAESGLAKPCIRIHPETGETAEYPSVAEAGRANHIGAANIGVAIKTGGKSGGYYWDFQL